MVTRFGRARGNAGLITLEWLLITGAVGAFAALAALVVERTLNDEVDVPADPAVRLIDADIDAAFVATDAVRTAVRKATDEDPASYSPADNNAFAARCYQVSETYSDVVELQAGVTRSDVTNPDHPWDWDWNWDPSATPNDPLDPDDYPEGPARCRITPRPPAPPSSP